VVVGLAGVRDPVSILAGDGSDHRDQPVQVLLHVP
jgi:hypothetical protein